MLTYGYGLTHKLHFVCVCTLCLHLSMVTWQVSISQSCDIVQTSSSVVVFKCYHEICDLKKKIAL